MQQVKTYRYKLKPTKAQQIQFEQWLGACRYVYNLSLDYKKTLWDHCKISIDKYALQKELTLIRRETDWISSVCGQTLVDVTDRLYKAYDSYFKQGKGYPKFAKKGQYRSFGFKQDVKIDPTHIRLPLIGKVHYHNSQPCTGTIRQAIVSQRADGWYVSVIVKTDIDPLPTNSNHIGIDLGIKSLLVTSDGESIENPRHLYKAEHKLKRLQRSVSRKKKGSSNRRKALNKLSRQYQKVANTRKDFHHKITTKLIRENQSISAEELRISNMLANPKLAKSIGDAGWYQLTQFFEYKAKWYGRSFEKVAARYTSQDCSGCGYRNTELTLAVRSWTCPTCGLTHDRDVNAAVNIKHKAVGHTVSASEIYSRVTGVAEESR